MNVSSNFKEYGKGLPVYTQPTMETGVN